MTGQTRGEGVSVKRGSSSKEFKRRRKVLEVDNAFARQEWKR